jgi:septum formation protein
MKDIILASASPDRKNLLSWLNIPFDIIVSGFDEESIVIDDPEELAATLATQKARKVANQVSRGVIIGSDTVIYIDGEFVAKPDDIDDARRILKKLRGKTHQVFTGVAIISADTSDTRVEVEETKVTFYDFTDEQLEEYLKTGEPMNKAGAYQLLGQANSFVEDIVGSTTNVTGLPLRLTADLLEEMGIPVDVDIESVVMENTGFKD